MKTTTECEHYEEILRISKNYFTIKTTFVPTLLVEITPNYFAEDKVANDETENIENTQKGIVCTIFERNCKQLHRMFLKNQLFLK